MDRKRGVNNNGNKLLYDPNQRKQRRLGAFSMEENAEEVENDSEEELENQKDTAVNEDTTTNNVGGNEVASSQAVNTKNAGGTRSVVKDVAMNSLKQGGKVAGKLLKAAGKRILMFIIANPWVLFIIGIALIILLIILI